MNDDQMDEMLTQGVRDYNEPGDVPREAMWKRIAEARRAPVRSGSDIPASGKRPVFFWSGVGVAAALVLSLGIVIGRRMDRSAPTAAPVAVSPVASATPAARPVVNPAESSTVGSARQAVTRDSLVERAREQTRRTDQRVRELAQAPAAARGEMPRDAGPARRSATGAGASVEGGSDRLDNQNLAYRLVVLQHLAGSEAMITSFQGAARRGEIDAQIASWSRELLSTTRLLEASQASADPMMKRLLEDLDLVISQIVQYTTRGTTNSEELDLIEQSINKRGVMTKLRSTLPGRVSAGT